MHIWQSDLHTNTCSIKETNVQRGHNSTARTVQTQFLVLSLRNNCPSSSQPPLHPRCCSAQHQPKQKPFFFVAHHLHADGLHTPLPAVPYSPAVSLQWKLGLQTSKLTYFSRAETIRVDPKPRPIEVLFSKGLAFWFAVSMNLTNTV